MQSKKESGIFSFLNPADVPPKKAGQSALEIFIIFRKPPFRVRTQNGRNMLFFVPRRVIFRTLKGNISYPKGAFKNR